MLTCELSKNHLRIFNCCIDQVAKDVCNHNVDFLNASGRPLRHMKVMTYRRAELSAVASGQTDGRQAQLARSRHGRTYVRRIAARRDRDGYVSRASESPDLPHKYLVEAVVIPDRGEDGGICREGDRGQRTPFARESADHFRRNVLRIGCAATVAKNEDLVALTQRFEDHVRYRNDPVFIRGEEGLLQLQARCHGVADNLMHGPNDQSAATHMSRKK